MIPFIRNNIELREVTSLSLSNFLSSKSFMLGQVSRSEPHKFSKTAKEILLQSYRIWTEWLFGLEEICIEVQQNIFSDEAMEHAIKLAELKSKELQDLFLANPVEFNPKFASLWIEILDGRKPYSLAELRSAMRGHRVSEAYKEVTLWLIAYMNHLLFNLHEIDYLMFCESDDKRPFIYLDEVDVNFYMSSELSVLSRVKLYEKAGLLNTTELDLKRVLRKQVLANSESSKGEKARVAESLIKQLTDEGYSITLT